jgi:hypothetical protein
LIESDAATLFTERAHAVHPQLTIGQADQSAIVEICRQLDGIPSRSSWRRPVCAYSRYSKSPLVLTIASGS